MEDTAIIADSARPATASALDRLRTRDKVAAEYRVVLDKDWAAESIDVAEEIGRKRLSNADDPALVELESRKAALDARRDEATMLFRFGRCGPVRYEELLSEHRPTAEQREQAKEAGPMAQPRWAPSFRPAFVSEVLIEPALSAEEVDELFTGLLSPAEAMELFNVAMSGSTAVARFEMPT